MLDKITYPLLIAEDAKDDLMFLRNAIKRECKGDIWLDIKECRTGAETRAELRATLYPFVSLDRRMPEHANGELFDYLGDHLRELAVRLNPLSNVAMFTAYPEYRSAYKAGTDGSIYAGKTGDMTAGEYAKVIVNGIRTFERRTIWLRAASLLPPHLAGLAKDIADRDDSEGDALMRSACASSLWETGIHLIALMELALAAFIKPALLGDVHLPLRRLDNESVILAIQRLTPELQGALEHAGYPTQAREVGRFIGHSSFMPALRLLQTFRNKSAHNRPAVARSAFLESSSAFVIFLTGLSLWALHPLVTGLKVVPWGTSNGLTGRSLQGAWDFAPTQTWIWDPRGGLQIDPAHIYQALIEPEAEDKALLIPLFPLVRVEPAGDGLSLWLADDLSRGLYWNVTDGTRQRFGDGALTAWWNQHHIAHRSMGSVSQLQPQRDAQPPGRMSEAVGETTLAAETPGKRLRENVRDFYVSGGRADPKENDERYQASFDGAAKAREFLHFVDGKNDLRLSDCAYVSIGGGDGSEIAHVMLNSPVRMGILVETSDSGAARARESREVLMRNGKELVVLQGDAMHRIQDCGGILSGWRSKGMADGVILSLQSVLHELPSRSPRYDPNILLASIFEPFQRRVFYSREPATPKEWPPVVHIRMKDVAGSDLEGLARQVNDVLAFKDDRIGVLADGFVQMSDELAVEVLFKLLYCRDSERYRYEMQEKLTGFEPEVFCRILRNFIAPAENVEYEYCLTETFRAHYRALEVEARTPTNDKLGLPKAFVRITGVQSKT